MFAINNKYSFGEVEEFLTKINDVCPNNIIKVLVGNKKDLEDERKVLNETGFEYAKDNDIL